jgi:voltage-gated potassium channel
MTTHPETLAPADAEPRRERWERATELPLTVAAVLFLIVYALPILDPSIRDGGSREAFEFAAATVWGFFVIDYVARLLLSRRRLRFVRTHILDLAVVVLPLLRPLRLLRLITILGVLNRAAGTSLRGKVATYTVGGTVMVLLVASLAMLDAERQSPDANIHDYGDSLWWAFTTVTTVGYGDRFPVTLQGRAIAISLMLAGIALLGLLTASLASWLIERVQEVEEESQAATRRDVAALTAEVATLRELLVAYTSQTRSGPDPTPRAG